MTSQGTAATERSGGRSVFVALMGWLVSYFAARFAIESGGIASDQARLLLAFVPAPFFGLFVWRIVRAVRGEDELERRIQLEALAVAFPLGVLLLSTLGLAQRAITLSFEDWSYNHVWPMFALFYIIGLTFARRRYA
ncbi:MAG: hypothetical protein IBJ03_15635 [Gemmatimonadaceae bacterium]|nr:hypothetical protein [Gemmatimonadaceae bacterium]